MQFLWAVSFALSTVPAAWYWKATSHCDIHCTPNKIHVSEKGIMLPGHMVLSESGLTVLTTPVCTVRAQVSQYMQLSVPPLCHMTLWHADTLYSYLINFQCQDRFRSKYFHYILNKSGVHTSSKCILCYFINITHSSAVILICGAIPQFYLYTSLFNIYQYFQSQPTATGICHTKKFTSLHDGVRHQNIYWYALWSHYRHHRMVSEITFPYTF